MAPAPSLAYSVQPRHVNSKCISHAQHRLPLHAMHFAIATTAQVPLGTHSMPT